MTTNKFSLLPGSFPRPVTDGRRTRVGIALEFVPARFYHDSNNNSRTDSESRVANATGSPTGELARALEGHTHGTRMLAL